MTHLSPEAERLADWLQATVNMYPQMSEDEPGGYATEFDQKVDEAAALLRRIPELEFNHQTLQDKYDALHIKACEWRDQVAGLEAELEAVKLGEAFHNKQANEYAQQVAHWIGKFDEVKAERDQLRAELEKVRPRPIETAPKGENVFLFSSRGLDWFVDDWGRYAKYNSPCITHWMPLPPPPATQGSEE